MARHPRVTVPGVAVHIVQRGVNRQRCFSSDGDYLVYLCILRKALERSGCALHAYCLMTNHVHLLLTPAEEGSCSQLMYEVGQRYVPYFNRRHMRTGTLWQGRFRSCLVDSREYVLSCYRYIELNPVRAGMVAAAADYRWSSYRTNIGQHDDAVVTAHPEYEALAADTASRRFAYRRFCEAGESTGFLAAVRDATKGGIPLVSESLKARLAKHGSRVARGRPGRPPEQREPPVSSGELDF